ncbi:YcgN family cysteine cluster protein [Pelagibius sp. 7325]|uniref:YcgN family cysteine cluster protein n=1 Tax=Pelagibius sp. 7325 TaxID=3131994 RepID=UPI0030EF28CF
MKKPQAKPGPFWQTKTLAEMTPVEWESLCDGCGRCCLIKLEDPDDGTLAHTNVTCHLLDLGTCRCGNYAKRTVFVPDCVQLSPENIGELTFMPTTCAYRRLAEGRGLAWWHPLVSGDPESVHRAGISVQGRVVSEAGVADEDLEDHIVDWPNSEETCWDAGADHEEDLDEDCEDGVDA